MWMLTYSKSLGIVEYLRKDLLLVSVSEFIFFTAVIIELSLVTYSVSMCIIIVVVTIFVIIIMLRVNARTDYLLMMLLYLVLVTFLLIEVVEVVILASEGSSLKVAVFLDRCQVLEAALAFNSFRTQGDVLWLLCLLLLV